MLLLSCLFIASHLLAQVLSEAIAAPEPARIPAR
jgi:hypothetical protein